MILLNFSHPLTESQLAHIEACLDQPIDSVKAFTIHFDTEERFIPQVKSLVDNIQLSPTEWQTLPLLINPPSLNHIALVLIAELHGRMGYFPAIIRMKPIPNSIPPQFEFAEIINLQIVREEARDRR